MTGRNFAKCSVFTIDTGRRLTDRPQCELQHGLAQLVARPAAVEAEAGGRDRGQHQGAPHHAALGTHTVSGQIVAPSQC